MDIITSNQYLKAAITDVVSRCDLEKEDEVVIIDLSSQYILPERMWGRYSRFIIIINDDSDIMLFNNVRVNSPVFYIRIDMSIKQFNKALLDALSIYPAVTLEQYWYVRDGGLSKRQFLVLLLTAKGLSLRQISLAVGISIKLISGYRIAALKRINKKMSVVTFNKLRFLLINQGVDYMLLKPTNKY